MTLSRKQREIAKRHKLFLDIAHDILVQDGFHLLSMERIAEIAEYSKGTVYHHFSCKEEILIQLCIQSMTELRDLFERASSIEGSSRDRMTAVIHAHHLWSCIANNRADMMQHLSMHGVLDKVTEESREKHDELEQAIVGSVASIVGDAIASGDLPEMKHMTATELVFGCWSLSTGGQMLQASDLNLENLGVRNPSLTLVRTMLLVLDGLNWKPLHDEKHFQTLLKHLNENVFADEFSRMT